MSNLKPATHSALLRRYLLTGAAVGLYFGYFFRPVREPGLFLVVGLSLLAALVTVGLKAWRFAGAQRPAAVLLLQRFVVTWGQYALALAALEGRHLAYDWGGRLAVVALTTLAGALLGAWLAMSQPPKAAKRA